MRKIYLVYAVLLSVLCTACASRLKVKGESDVNLPSLKKTENVVIIEENENLPTQIENLKVGVFEIKDGAMSLDCSYERVLNIARNKARSVGANTVKIIEHKLPDLLSLCHRIQFEVYKLEDISPFQKDVAWSSSNPLKWEYFKGAPKFTQPSFFCGYIDVQFNDIGFSKGEGEVNIIPLFDFECSYVQPLEKNAYLLEYNQVKFDLMEVYARKMRSEYLKSEINTNEKWSKFAKGIYDKIYRDYETDIFNLETETNFGKEYSQLIGWKYKAEKGLKELTEFSSDVY
ncbi:MAG: hypothetical protein WA951_09105 [Leeuwenhoekiella sp.]